MNASAEICPSAAIARHDMDIQVVWFWMNHPKWRIPRPVGFVILSRLFGPAFCWAFLFAAHIQRYPKIYCR